MVFSIATYQLGEKNANWAIICQLDPTFRKGNQETPLIFLGCKNHGVFVPGDSSRDPFWDGYISDVTLFSGVIFFVTSKDPGMRWSRLESPGNPRDPRPPHAVKVLLDT